MRVGVELLPHPDSAINPAASNGTVKIDSVDVFMAFSLLLLRCCSPDIISNLLAPDQRSGSQLGLLLPAMSCAFKLYYYSHDELWRFASCFLSLRGPGTSTGDDGRGEIVYIDRGSKTVMSHARAGSRAAWCGRTRWFAEVFVTSPYLEKQARRIADKQTCRKNRELENSEIGANDRE